MSLLWLPLGPGVSCRRFAPVPESKYFRLIFGIGPHRLQSRMAMPLRDRSTPVPKSKYFSSSKGSVHTDFKLKYLSFFGNGPHRSRSRSISPPLWDRFSPMPKSKCLRSMRTGSHRSRGRNSFSSVDKFGHKKSEQSLYARTGIREATESPPTACWVL